MSEWFAAGSGGFRPACPLIAFGIACPPPSQRRRVMNRMSDSNGAEAEQERVLQQIAERLIANWLGR
jgi:hypothetical protein